MIYLADFAKNLNNNPSQKKNNFLRNLAVGTVGLGAVGGAAGLLLKKRIGLRMPKQATSAAPVPNKALLTPTQLPQVQVPTTTPQAAVKATTAIPSPTVSKPKATTANTNPSKTQQGQANSGNWSLQVRKRNNSTKVKEKLEKLQYYANSSVRPNQIQDNVYDYNNRLLRGKKDLTPEQKTGLRQKRQQIKKGLVNEIKLLRNEGLYYSSLFLIEFSRF